MRAEEPSTAAAQRLSRSTSLFLFRPPACLECDEAEADEALNRLKPAANESDTDGSDGDEAVDEEGSPKG